MDLIHNVTFRIARALEPKTNFAPGIYRVVLDEPLIEKTIVVLIESEGDLEKKSRGGRRKKRDDDPRHRPKRAPTPLVGHLLWMDRAELAHLADAKLLTIITIDRFTALELGERSRLDYEKRIAAMAGFLNVRNLQESILQHEGLGGLVREAIAKTGVSRAFVYRQWSNLCRWGFDDKSLIPRRDRCGAPGVSRPCDPSAEGKQTREKAGRKTLNQRILSAYGTVLDPDQPGMSTEWAAAIRAADMQIPTPKPAWPRRCRLIVMSAFCGKAKEEDGKLVLVKPEYGKYPNNDQIKRVLTVEKPRLELLLERTTRRHFERALRGLIARNWQGVAGPGHTWAIDSTVGDVYLRSSVNRAWIVGRPIVYVIVDIWSTAVVGFYVCLSGPSWSTARVSLFNAVADPALVAEMWGYQPLLCLEPAPSLCYALLCDRAEYLSQGQRETALRLQLPLTSYTPPYRGDLKGLAEVIHRIEKDSQFLFVPGAMDYRRAELELRRINPDDCVLTVREYTQYLYELFTAYNLTADRSHRVDAHMRAAGVFPSPAGLWRWGHAMGVGFRRHISEADLISHLLPSGKGRVQRDAVRFASADYSSEEIKAAQWTAQARNFGGWEIPVHYYPGAMGRIWVPHVSGSGLMDLRLSDESSVSPEVTSEEWADVLALATMQRAGEEHQRRMDSLDSQARIQAILENAKRQTAEALAKVSGKVPSISEARAMELAATSHPSPSEAEVSEPLRDEAIQAHEEMMAALLESNNYGGSFNGSA